MSIENADSPVQYRDSKLKFQVRLKPGKSWHTCVKFTPIIEEKTLRPLYRCRQFFGIRNELDRKRHIFLNESTDFHTRSEPKLAGVVESALLQAMQERMVTIDRETHMLPANFTVFATQNPGDLLSSDQGSVVATNPADLFLGAQRPGEAAKLQEVFHLSPQQRGALEVAQRGDFLLAAGTDRLAVHIQAPPWQEDAMQLARTAARPPP